MRGLERAEYLNTRRKRAERKPPGPRCRPRPTAASTPAWGRPRVSQGGGTAAETILTPGESGGGSGTVVFYLFISQGCLYYCFLTGGDRRRTRCGSHSPEGRRVWSGGGPRGLAPERVGADGSGSQSSRRSCGAPGTSGRCQAWGLDPACGRSVLSPSSWLLRA